MIGSEVPISIVLESLLKGLTIGKVFISLREYYTYGIPGESSYSDYRIIRTIRIDDPDPQENLDMWLIKDSMKLPASLARCTQDCDTGYIKIRHK